MGEPNKDAVDGEVLEAAMDSLSIGLTSSLTSGVNDGVIEAVIGGKTDAMAVMAAVLGEKLADAQTPGFWAEFAPDEAELAGAFEEAALDETEAAASGIDLLALKTDEGKERIS